jgi:hypothetical protein
MPGSIAFVAYVRHVGSVKTRGRTRASWICDDAAIAREAVLIGNGWAATVEAGSSNRLDVDPAKIATQLGGQVLRVWP